MIIRKPYAFLIKNFKKVHTILLVISLYVMYKLLGLTSFISDFMNLGTYDYYNEPITKHISLLLYLAIIILILGSFVLMLLLKRKNKPWKIYLVSLVEYISLVLVLAIISNFFKGYSNDVAATDIRLSRDLLMILLVGNFISIGIFLLRTIGMDLHKFNFNKDEEYLELSEDDREEVELRVRFDKKILTRLFNKFTRYLRYFYLEHKILCNTTISLIGIVVLFSMGRFFFITNKTYSEGDLYKIDGYSIKVNKSYLTNKDGVGKVISKNSNFVIVDLTVTNNSSKRVLTEENFHLKSGISDYTTTRKTYEKEFSDLGNTYDSVKELKTEETIKFIIIFKVDKNTKQKDFVLCYQEKNGSLRKIKLNITDINKMAKPEEFKLGEKMTISLKENKEVVSFDKYSFSKTGNYMVRRCSSENCYTQKENYSAEEGKTVLKIDFASNNFEGKEMVDFSTNYGKIIYIDNSKMEQSVTFKYPFKKKALGKYIYTLVPDEVAASGKLAIVYTVRNKKYTYRLK